MSKIKQKVTAPDKSSPKNSIVALKNLLNYYKDITTTLREPFLILTNDLYVLKANPAFYQKFKVYKKDTEGKLVYKLGNNQWDRPELRELLDHILPKNRKLTNYKITLNFPSLGRKTMLLNARQIDSKQLILLAIEDITNLRNIQLNTEKITANLIKQRDDLQSLNEAKDEFISLASHQLRTPATAVKQYVGMVTEGYAGKISKAQKKMLNVAYASNERQLEIIEELLKIAKMDAGKVYLRKLCYDLVPQIRSAINGQAILFKKRRQTIIFQKPDKSMVVFMDPNLMLMVLENILDNAGKYSPKGSQVTIEIKQTEKYTMILITDNGVGIRKADQQKLFKKFSRIDNPLSTSVKGTGLGLYWAKKVLDLHGGTIEVSSTLRKGSTFIIKTPNSTDNLLKLPVVL